MNITRNARVAAIATVAIFLLAGCSSTDGNQTAHSAGPVTAKVPTSTPIHAKRTPPMPQFVSAITFVDPMNVIVTEKGGASFTMHLSGIKTPAPGECGHDEATAFSEKLLTTDMGPAFSWKTEYFTTDGGGSDGKGGDEWIAPNGDRFGGLNVNGGDSYNLKMIQGGYAYADTTNYLTIDPSPYAPINFTTTNLVATQKKFLDNGTFGLWKTCPGFGK